MSYTERSNAVFKHLVTNFSQELSTEHTNEILCTLSLSLLDELSEDAWLPIGYDLHDSITHGDVPYLCNYDPDVLDLTASDQRIIRQISAFFRKREDVELEGVDPLLSGYAKFREAEGACRLTNACFRAWSQGRFQFRPEVERLLHGAQLKISNVLEHVGYGGLPPPMSEIPIRFGPGANTATPKATACPATKLKGMLACSANFPRLEEALNSIFCVDGESGAVDVEITNAALGFVPKTAKIKRAIVTEPPLNGMFQLGLGDQLAAALRSAASIDIRDQSANQRAALYGSISGQSATIDLSSASDTIARGLVRHLFPLDWAELLESLASPSVEIPAEVQYYLGDCDNENPLRTLQLEKLSSMGNGFTFPIETLIFWSLAQTAKELWSPRSRVRVLVYGDDIIVPTQTAQPLIRALHDLGFTANVDKTFFTGNFRESCGSDYVYGTDVRPTFVDNRLTGESIFVLHNGLQASGWAGHNRLCSMLSELIDPSIRLWGPKGFGDGHLHTEDIARWNLKRKGENRGWEGYTFQTWTYRPKYLRLKVAQQLIKIDRAKARPPQKGSRSSQHVTWRSKFLLRQLATYTAMIASYRDGDARTRRDTIAAREGRAQFVRHERVMPNPASPKDDRSHLVVPGKGSVVRTEVYIFEPSAA